MKIHKSKCRYCGNSLHTVFDLGKVYPSAFIDLKDKNKYNKQPLGISECSNCGLVQSSYDYDLNSLYKDYFYKSGANKSMVASLQDIVSEVEKRIKLKNDSVVLDIGANDGTLLSLYKNKKLLKIGIDPGNTFNDDLKTVADITVNDFFDTHKYPIKKKASVITFIACFYDLPNIRSVIKELKSILDDNGILVIQFTDLCNMLALTEFSNICQEHLEYYSKDVLIKFFKDFDLEVFDISENDTNGGSTRFYISHTGVYKKENSVDVFLRFDKECMRSFKDFKYNVKCNKKILICFLKQMKREGKVVVGLGSSTKFNTLAQYYKLNSSLIKAIGEISSIKIGKYTLGSNIPIISEEDMFKMNPDVIVVNIWQFRKFFETKLKDFVDKGGSVVFPLPEPELWNSNGVFKIGGMSSGN